MGIPAQIFNRIAKAIESFFDVRAPVFPVKGIPEFGPFIRIPEPFAGSRENQQAVLEEGLQARKKLTFEFIPEDFHPEKEIFLYFPNLMVRGKATARNNAVHMCMAVDFLVPGVEDLNDAGCCAQMLFISGKL